MDVLFANLWEQVVEEVIYQNSIFLLVGGPRLLYLMVSWWCCWFCSWGLQFLGRHQQWSRSCEPYFAQVVFKGTERSKYWKRKISPRNGLFTTHYENAKIAANNVIHVENVPFSVVEPNVNSNRKRLLFLTLALTFRNNVVLHLRFLHFAVTVSSVPNESPRLLDGGCNCAFLSFRDS